MSLEMRWKLNSRTMSISAMAHAASVSLATSKPDPDDAEYTAVATLAEAEPFRNSEGTSVQGKLHIPFHLFVPLESRDQLPPSAATANITLPFAELGRFLTLAEDE
ncbi:hypothetical protein F5Y18DRAFT_424627 [Xylariaceae sp. FL1019]|nr:hypothetical protein F5Y18DRAFT_424627 [Xylariaceae sp. FL1019]